MLELIDLTIVRGGTPLIRGLTLQLRPGQVFWVVGPNGAGKSSLLRVLAGLDRPAWGRLRSRGPTPFRPLYFHSEMRIPFSASVGDWERLADRLRRTPDRRAVARAGGLGLWPAVAPRRATGQLSTGERKRLLLDVLLRLPGPVLLDEPFEHLSPDAKDALAGLLEERALRHIVVVATNQATHRVDRDGGLRLGEP